MLDVRGRVFDTRGQGVVKIVGWCERGLLAEETVKR